jgi:3-oxoacyl-[acyl-carrier protein] reductase/2-hydroxycyclohexanecarboxyl-CoA dehydrogenase
VALVTGAGRGIGEAIASRLAEEGARLVVFDLEQGAVEALAQRFEAGGTQALAVAGDAASTADAERAVSLAVERFGRLDILVNNAGINRDAQLGKMTDEQWDAVLDVDLKGPFLFARAAAVPMRVQQYGRIVSMSSSSWLGNFGQANYAAAKAGLIGLTRTLAVELARHQITANAICPGWIDTPMTRGVPDAVADRVISNIRLGRAGQPRDVANLVLFLASDEAAYITGQHITICGGLTVGMHV